MELSLQYPVFCLDEHQITENYTVNFLFLDWVSISYSVQIYIYMGVTLFFILILAIASEIHFLYPLLTEKPDYGYNIIFPGIHLYIYLSKFQ